MGDILKLVQKTQRERIEVAAFLREWADAVENDGETTSAVIILHGSVGDSFRVRVRRCNMDLLEAIGLVQVAKHDMSDPD